MKNIYLVGFMGTGKSVVGKALARKKKMRFLDLDELIEKKENRKITEIFAEDSEAYFRRLEKENLARISEMQDCVVSCGGGIVIDPENIKIMKATGTIVCLSASPEVILKRTREFRHRPILNVADPEKKIVSLLNARAPFYARADKTIDTTKLSVKEVVRVVLEFIDEQNE